MAGLFDANFTVDPTGNTPDLSRGLSAGPVPGGGAVHNYVFASFGADYVPGSEPQHVVCQFPVGGSWELGLGTDITWTKGNFSGFTVNRYTTPASYIYEDWGLNAVVDTIAEHEADPIAKSHLHQYLSGDDETGDFLTATMWQSWFYGIAFQSEYPSVLWQLWLSFVGVPTQRLTPILPTLPAGGGSFARAGQAFPLGFGDSTFTFVAIGGVRGVEGSVHISNEVTLTTLKDPVCRWGIKDDGTMESYWIVSYPTGSSDYLSNWFKCLTPPGVTTVTDMKVAVLDFGTRATSFPRSGVFAANYAVDPSGWTPDLSTGWGVQPFTFPPGTLATTSAQYVVNDFADIPYSTFGTDDVHGVIQFPPGETGRLGIGGDTTPTPTVLWGSTWTDDGYATPANRYDRYAGWGLRLGAL
ncbi:MAG: hypothetical protein AB1486_15615 [Planctomycetota bacterium]